MEITKGVVICLISVIVIFIASAVTSFIIMHSSDREDPKENNDTNYVEIVQDNKIVYIFDLNSESDRTFRIECPKGGWNDITIENSQIFISDSDCPDKTCVNMGKLRSEYAPIVCLPHKLVIRFSDRGDE